MNEAAVAMESVALNPTLTVKGSFVRGVVEPYIRKKPRTAIKRVVIMGPPGVGKGTYATFLAPRLGLKHVVVGDLVRNEISQATPLGLQMADVVRQGKLIEDDVIMQLVFSHLKGLDGFLLDGMPRTLKQALALDAIVPLDLALNLSMDEEIMLRKACARRIGPANKVYNLAYVKKGMFDMPPHLPAKTWCDAVGRLFCKHDVEIRPNEDVQCPACTEGLSAREDDNPEVWHHRMQTYKSLTCPVLAHYAAKNMTVEFSINGDVKACAPRLLELLQEYGTRLRNKYSGSAVDHFLPSRI